MRNVSYLPEPDEQEWILEHLAELIRHRGAGVFLGAPLLEPTPRFFPGQWSPTERNLRALIGRLMRYAGLHLPIRLELYDEGSVPLFDHRGINYACHRAGDTVAWFAGLDGDEAYFGVEVGQLDDPVILAGTLCHEVAHAFRANHGLEYFERELDEPLTDLTTVYLGFGLLTTGASHRHRVSRESDSHQSSGYMSALPMSFALAAQAVARKLDLRARKRLAKHLGPNQAAYFLAGARALEAPAGLLAARLGLPEVAASGVVPFNRGLTVYRLRRGLFRSPYCSDPSCGVSLSRRDVVCPGCGGSIGGDVASQVEAAEREAASLSGAGKDELARLLRGDPDEEG